MLRIRLVPAMLILITASSLFAQATRTWVSGVGSDANPCSRSAPCKTFAGAYANTAANGEIDVLDPGGYGGLTISKGLRIDGRGFVSSILASSITVNTTDHVELANLQLNGTNSISVGIWVTAAGSLLIDNCDITAYYSDGVYINAAASTPVQILNSRIHNLTAGANGVYASTSSGTVRLRVTNSVITDNWGSYGVWTNGGVVAVIDRTQISGCYAAVRADSTSVVDVSASNFSHHTGWGIISTNTNSLVRIYESFIQDCTSGGFDVTGTSAIQSAGNNSIQAGTGTLLSWGLQ